MGYQHEDVFAVSDPHQSGAKEGSSSKIERSARLLPHETLRTGLALDGWRLGQIMDRHAQRARGGNHLDGLAIDSREDRPQ